LTRFGRSFGVRGTLRKFPVEETSGPPLALSRALLSKVQFARAVSGCRAACEYYRRCKRRAGIDPEIGTVILS
jgi:hypothetical protein